MGGVEAACWARVREAVFLAVGVVGSGDKQEDDLQGWVEDGVGEMRLMRFG